MHLKVRNIHLVLRQTGLSNHSSIHCGSAQANEDAKSIRCSGLFDLPDGYKYEAAGWYEFSVPSNISSPSLAISTSHGPF